MGKKIEKSNNVVDEVVTIDFSKMSTQWRKMFEEEMKIYCDCKKPDDSPYYVEKHKIKGVGMVNHHGWVCHKCDKYTQVG